MVGNSWEVEPSRIDFGMANAGIYVEQLADTEGESTYLFHCNAGPNRKTTFDDLIFQLRVNKYIETRGTS